MQLRGWKRIDKADSALVGFAAIALPYRGGWLVVDKVWATWPGKPVLTREGLVARIPGTGRIHYVSILRWEGRGVATRFSQAVVDLVRRRDPGAFERAAP
jgi:hypothetical protein